AQPIGSEELATAMAPLLTDCIGQFGPAQCRCESNFPPDKVSFSHHVLCNAFKRFSQGYAPADRAALFHDTAARAYRISAASGRAPEQAVAAQPAREPPATLPGPRRGPGRCQRDALWALGTRPRRAGLPPSWHAPATSAGRGAWARACRLDRVMVTVRQPCADRVPLGLAHQSTARLCGGRRRGPGIVRAMLSHIRSDPLHTRLVQDATLTSQEAPMKTRWQVWLSLFVVVVGWTGLGWTQQPRYGGTLRLALPGDPAFYNANQGPAPGAQAGWTGSNIYNSLLTITPPPALTIVPALAKSLDVLDDGRTYVFHLEEGVTFHDGTAFDAAAAKWNIDRILDPAVHSWVRTYYEDITQVEAVDTYTLRIRLKEPSGALPIALGGYFQGIPMASPKAFETYGKDWLYHPVGTGPYIFKEWVPGKHVILEKNPNYWKKGLPYIDRLEFRVMKDPLTAATALRAGEIDFITRVPMQQVPLLEKIPGLKVITGPEMASTIALLNMRVKPFDDVRARRAVGGYGLDRGEIAKVAFQGRAK